MWHFTGCEEDGIPILGFEDGREEPIGVPLSVEGDIALCKNGLHACESLLGAINFVWCPLEDWFGVTLGRVELSGDMVTDDRKYAARTRTVIERLTFKQTLEFFRELNVIFMDRLMKESIITPSVREFITTKDYDHYHSAIMELYGDNSLYRSGSYEEVYHDENGWYFKSDIRSAIGLIVDYVKMGESDIDQVSTNVQRVIYIYRLGLFDSQKIARNLTALESIAVRLFYTILHREDSRVVSRVPQDAYPS